MDICPPPSHHTRQEKARMKRKCYKERKRQAKLHTRVSGSDSSPDAQIDAESLRQKIQHRRETLLNMRTGAIRPSHQELSEGSTRDVNRLLEKFGICDPAMKAKILKMIKSGTVSNTPWSERHIAEQLTAMLKN